MKQTLFRHENSPNKLLSSGHHVFYLEQLKKKEKKTL